MGVPCFLHTDESYLHFNLLKFLENFYLFFRALCHVCISVHYLINFLAQLVACLRHANFAALRCQLVFFVPQHKYPIGSGRVTFNNAKSYMKAVAAAFIEIKTQVHKERVKRI